MLINEDVYLEHYGKKGMRWGVRKARDTSVDKSGQKKERKKLTPQQKQLLVVGGIVAASAGAIIAGHILGQNNSRKVSSLNNVRSLSEIKRIEALGNLNKVLSTPVSRINNVQKPGAIPMGPVSKARQKLQEDVHRMGTARLKKRGSEQVTIDLLKKRHTELNKAANGDLRRWYERSQTPLHRRSYLNDNPYG